MDSDRDYSIGKALGVFCGRFIVTASDFLFSSPLIVIAPFEFNSKLSFNFLSSLYIYIYLYLQANIYIFELIYLPADTDFS